MNNSEVTPVNNYPTTIRKFFLGAGLIGITNAALQLKGLILIPIISKQFGAIGYGAWTQVAVLVSLLTPLVGMGIENGYYRYMSSASRTEQVQSLWNSIFVKTVTCGLVGLLLWVLSGSIAQFWFGDLESAPFVAICGFVIYSTLFANDTKSFFRISQQAGWFSTFTLIQGFGNIGAVITVFLLGGGIFEIVAAGAGFDLVLSIVVLMFLGFKYRLGRFDVSLLKKFISFGAVLMPTAYAMWALNLSDRLFLAYYRTLSDIGIYSVAYNLGYIMVILFYGPIWTLYPPAATKAWEEGNIVQIQDLFQKSAKLTLGLLIPGIVGIALIGKPLILHLSNSEFLPGAPLMPLIALGYLFLMVGSFWSVNLSLGMKQKISGFSSIGAALLNILLNWLLIPPWGITGAALSTLFAFSLQFGIDFWFGRKILTLHIPFDFIKKSLISSAVMSVVGLFGVSWAMESKLNLILLVISCSAVYFISLSCLKAFHLRELGFNKEA
jgi:O-antigen/teichoic acid export membrane protein